MKRIQYLFSVLMVSCMFVGCNDSEYDAIDNSVYLADAAASLTQEKLVAVDTAGATFPVVVRLAKPVDYDIEVLVSIDADAAVTAYNKLYGTTYNALPAEYRDFAKEHHVTIKAQDLSGILNLHVKTFTPQEDKYALSLSIKSLSGNVSTSSSQNQYLFVFDKKMVFDDHYITAVTPKFKYLQAGGGAALLPAPTAGWNLKVGAYTLEFWARMEMYSTQNYGLFSIYGNDNSIPDNYEFYFRFGDANQQSGNANGTRCYINWKAWGLNLTGDYDLIKDRWYHWVCVYDGTYLYVYRNGEVYMQTRCKYAGSEWVMHSFEMISSHQNTANTVNLSEVRLWTKALSREEIRANMYYEIVPDQPDLEAYWKMNEGSNFNGSFIDATGHGHDIEVKMNHLSAFGWTDPQTFSPSN